MKKLGKKVRNNAGSLQMFSGYKCTNCGCGIHMDSSTSMYNNQKN